MLRYYDGNPALRPMNDFDVLVPRERAVDAISVLVDHGWRSALPQPELLPEAYHSAGFSSRDGLDFDLHWHVVPAQRRSRGPRGRVDGGSAGRRGEATSLALGAEDLLVVVCAHAAQWSPIASVRWVADALAILRAEGRAFDWARAGTRAARWHVVPHLTDTLGYLRNRWRVDVPASVFAQLASAEVSRLDRRAYAVLGRMPGTADYLRAALASVPAAQQGNERHRGAAGVRPLSAGDAGTTSCQPHAIRDPGALHALATGPDGGWTTMTYPHKRARQPVAACNQRLTRTSDSTTICRRLGYVIVMPNFWRPRTASGLCAASRTSGIGAVIDGRNRQPRFSQSRD